MIYEAQCRKCKKVHEYHASLAECFNTPLCCGKKTVKGIFTPPQVGAMCWTSHKAMMVNGQWMETGGDYKKYMKETGRIPYEEGRQEAERVQKDRVKQRKVKRRGAIEKAIRQASN